jgi:glucose/arabinose dehydrogenase
MTARPAIAVLALGCAVFLGCSSDDSGSGPPPEVPPLSAELVESGLSHPLLVTAPPGNQTRLFVVERTGTIRIIKNGNLLPTPFLDITDKVFDGVEQGILGLAFAPDYATSHMFVLHYINSNLEVVISRFHAPSGTADVADTTEQVLLTVQQPVGPDHNGGTVTFGRDGYLYISLGDGGCCGDPQGHGQDRTELLGSILRIDVPNTGPYQIPPDNPWATHATFRHELWNYGLRNPWRFSFDRSTGDMYIGDVGDDRREEVDVISHTSTGGENLGWRVTEGLECYLGDPCDQTGITLPVLDYDHSEGCAVMGGNVYRGSAIPALRGTYFYADLCGGWVRSFRWVGGAATDQKDYPGLIPGGEQPNSFGEDAAGELYLTTEAGNVYRIVAE